MIRMTKLASALSALALLAACSDAVRGVAAAEPAFGETCALDGMTLKDYPGPKAQIAYQGGRIDFFCSLTELFEVLFGEDGERGIAAMYVQDMGRADWQLPQGHWIGARDAFYVVGSSAQGAMGKTIATFAREQDAQAFVRRAGGRVLRFNEITPSLTR